MADIERLITDLRTRDWRIYETAADKLVKIGLPAVEPLFAVLCDPDIDIHTRAADVL